MSTHADFHSMLYEASNGLNKAQSIQSEFSCGNDQNEEAARHRLIAARARVLALACDEFVAFLEKGER